MDRFKGAVWFPEIPNNKALIIGAGGIGSWTALMLGRLGLDTTIIDFDSVSKVNMSGQFYKAKDVNKYKTNCVEINVNEFLTSPAVRGLNIKYDREYIKLEDFSFIILAVDNFETRDEVFKDWYSNKNTSILYDARMSAEFFDLYTLNYQELTHDQFTEYETSLESLKSLKDDDCTYKQTSHVAAILAGTITSHIVKHMQNTVLPKFKLTIPFNRKYNGL